VEYLPDLEINKAYAATFRNNCAVISRTANGRNMGACAYHLADGKTCPVHGVVRAARPDLSRVAAELMTDEEVAQIDPEKHDR
jgi:alkylated DNA nucleotide flippase Atl1